MISLKKIPSKIEKSENWDIILLNQIFDTDAFSEISNIQDQYFDYTKIYLIYMELCDYLTFPYYFEMLSCFHLTNQMKSMYYYSNFPKPSKAFMTIIKDNYNLHDVVEKPDPICADQIIDICNKIKMPEHFKDSYGIFRHLQNLLVQYKYVQKPGLTILEIIIMSALSKCKVWSKVLKDAKTTNMPLPQLTEWYNSMLNQHETFNHFQIDPCIQSKKHLKASVKKSLIKQYDPNFLKAVRKGDINQVKELLIQGVDIETIDPSDKSKHASHIACAKGDLEMIKLLMLFGCNFEALDHEGMTSIYYAIESQNIEVIDYLLSQNVNPEHQECQARTPFYWSCCQSSLKIVKHLVEKGFIYNTYSILKRSPLSKACFTGRADIVNYLLSLPNIEIGVPDNRGRTPLHNACWGPYGGREGKKAGGTQSQDCPEAARMLLEKGADVNFKDLDGNTPLHVSMSSYALPSIPILIEFGADINALNNNLENPAYQGARWGNIEPVKFIFENYNADIWAENNMGLNSIDCSFYYEFFDMWSYFMKKEDIQKKLDKKKILNWLNISLKKSREDKNEWLRLLFELSESGKIEIDIDKETLFAIINLKDMTYLKKLISFINNKHDHTEIKKLIKWIVQESINTIWQDGFFEIYKAFWQIIDSSYFTISELKGIEKINCNFFRFVLENLHIDILDDGNEGETLLYLIVKQRKMDLLLDLLRIFKDTLSEKKFVNKFLRDIDQIKIKSWINRRNNEGFNAIEFAMIKKYMDLHTILNSFCGHDLKANFDIIQYRLEVEDAEQIRKYTHKHNIKLKEHITLLKSFIKPDKIVDIANELKIVHNIFDIMNSECWNYLKDLIDDIDMNSTDIFKKEIETKKLIIVNDEPTLKMIAYELETSSILGVDLEYFTENNKDEIGFVCLLQISSITTDYVIDTLLLRDQIGKYLAAIFESDKIIKVFHGCDGDLIWLKSNFDIDVVNLFDTCRAYMYITNDKQHISLANLSKLYLNLHLSKLYQTADWRIRPLPKAMLEYARKDSRVLLYLWWYIYHDLIKSKELIIKMGIKMSRMCFKVLEKSKLKKIKLEIIGRIMKN